VQVFSAVVVALGEGADGAGFFEFFEEAERHEGDDALPVGGVFPYFYTMGWG